MNKFRNKYFLCVDQAYQTPNPIFADCMLGAQINMQGVALNSMYCIVCLVVETDCFHILAYLYLENKFALSDVFYFQICQRNKFETTDGDVVREHEIRYVSCLMTQSVNASKRNETHRSPSWSPPATSVFSYNKYNSMLLARMVFYISCAENFKASVCKSSLWSHS